MKLINIKIQSLNKKQQKITKTKNKKKIIEYNKDKLI